MKMAPHPALAVGKAYHVGDAVAVVIAETLAQAKDAAEKVAVDYEVLPAVVDPAKAQEGRAADPRRCSQQHDLQLAPRRPRGDRGRVQGGQARHQARVHQQPPGAERDGAARRARRVRFRQREPHAVERHPKSARGAARDLGVCRHGAGEQAARDRARRRRRFRLEDFHLPGRGRLPVGGAQGQPPGEMDRRALGELHLRCAWPRSRHQAEMAFDADNKITGLQGATPSPISAPTCRPSPRRCRRSSTRRYCRANTTIPHIYCEVDAVYTNTVPVDAYRGAGRPGSDLRGRASGGSRRARAQRRAR